MSASSSPVNLKDAIQRLDTLPTMPAIAQKILALDLETGKGEGAMLKSN